MSVIYLDRSATALGGFASDFEARDALSSDAIDALRLLRDSGHELVFVEGEDGVPLELRGLGRVVPDVPTGGTEPAWFVTGELGRCASQRPGLTTVLVGPSVSGAAPSVVRCDLAARDLRAAAMEVLAREAMPERTVARTSSEPEPGSAVEGDGTPE
ncbi:MAG TPA: hypothetical protein VIM30_17190 [Candidatus Limnocylindrales bacterium]|jgi:hypothetical protein